MAKLPTAEDKARMVLSMFAHFRSRPNDVLGQNNLVAYAARNGLQVSDLADGVDHGYDLGWFDGGPNNGILLTEAGFAEMPDA